MSDYRYIFLGTTGILEGQIKALEKANHLPDKDERIAKKRKELEEWKKLLHNMEIEIG